jgi:hypothetical protein
MKPRKETTILGDRSFEAIGNITRVTYASSTRRLLVTFKGGNSYVYLDVPLDTYLALLAAENLGAAFTEYVRKPGFEYEKVQPRTAGASS